MTQVLAPRQKIDDLRGLLEKMKPQLLLALPRHLTPDRMARIALTACLKTPKLVECDQASFAGAMLTCAQMGLEPDGREAHLVPFWNSKRRTFEVQVIPGYMGLAKLARQSRQIKALDWREVRSGDVFEYRYGSNATLRHVPADAPAHVKENGEWVEARQLTHCYALAVLDSGESVFEVMRREDIEWHRDRYSRAAGDGPWVTNFPEMGAKTSFRKLAKKLPASTELMRAVELDERAEAGLPQDLSAVFEAGGGDVVDGAATNGHEEKPTTALDTLADDLEKKNGITGPEQSTPQPASEAPSPAGTSQLDLLADTTPTPPAAPAPLDRNALIGKIQARLDKLGARRAAPILEKHRVTNLDKTDQSVLDELMAELEK